MRMVLNDILRHQNTKVKRPEIKYLDNIQKHKILREKKCP